MTIDNIYCDLMLLASGVIAVLAVVLMNITIPHAPEFRKLKRHE